MIARIGIAIGTVVFLVLAGTGISFAYWSTNASTSGTVAVANLAPTTCSPAVQLVNGGFETPNISPAAYQQLPPLGTPAVPGWRVLNDTIVEIWRSQLGSTPPEGAQIAELNGMGFGTLYQDVATTPGQVLRWSLVHRGRDGTDSMRVDIGAAVGPATTQEQWSTSNAAFVRHSGVYTVPAGQTTTRLSLVPVATYNNNVSIGNLIDDVSFVSAPCLGAATTITNITRGGTAYYPGDVVEYITTVTNSGSSAAVGSVFSTVIPATLAYQAGSLQVASVARTDVSGDDVAEYVGGTQTVTARLGTGATAAAGGSLAPGASMTVRYRATVQAAAGGGTLVHTSSTAYADPLAPNWPLSAVSPTITTPVIAVADLATSVVSSPLLGAAIRGTQATWQFRITNNGPSTAAGVSASVALTGTFTAAASVQYNVSGTWLNCTTTGTPRTCTIGALASGATVDIRIQGTVPAAQANGSTYSMTTTAATTSSDTTASNNAATSSGTLDIVAPTTPGTPTTSAPTGTSVTLSWTASTDAVGVTGYRIFVNGVQVATSATNSTTVTGLTAGQPYYFWVQAVDAAGNASAVSGGTPFITTLGTGRYLVNYVNGGLCVGATSDLDDAQVQTLTCDSASPNQRWQFVVSGGGYIVSPQNGATRDWRVTTNNTTDGTKIFADLSGTSRKTWTLFVDWDATAQQAYLGIRRTDATTLCFDVNGGSATPGVQLQQWTCNASAAQRFRLTAAP